MSEIEEKVITALTCKNCETSFEGKYCPNCSQKADTHRFTLKHFLHDFFHALTHTDKGILFLAKEMFRKPGYVTKEIIEGRRKKYFNPFTFFLIAGAINVFLMQKTNFYGAFVDEMKALIIRIEQRTSEEHDKNAELRLDETRNATSKVMEYNKFLNFTFIPFLSLLTWLFYKKSGYNYAENLVLNILINGQMSVFFMLFCILPFLLYKPLVLVLPFLFIIGNWLYSVMAYRQFFQQRKWISFMKGTVVQIIFFVAMNVATNIVVRYL